MQIQFIKNNNTVNTLVDDNYIIHVQGTNAQIDIFSNILKILIRTNLHIKNILRHLKDNGLSVTFGDLGSEIDGQAEIGGNKILLHNDLVHDTQKLIHVFLHELTHILGYSHADTDLAHNFNYMLDIITHPTADISCLPPTHIAHYGTIENHGGSMGGTGGAGGTPTAFSYRFTDDDGNGIDDNIDDDATHYYTVINDTNADIGTTITDTLKSDKDYSYLMIALENIRGTPISFSMGVDAGTDKHGNNYLSTFDAKENTIVLDDSFADADFDWDGDGTGGTEADKTIRQGKLEVAIRDAFVKVVGFDDTDAEQQSKEDELITALSDENDVLDENFFDTLTSQTVMDSQEMGHVTDPEGITTQLIDAYAYIGTAIGMDIESKMKELYQQHASAIKDAQKSGDKKKKEEAYNALTKDFQILAVDIIQKLSDKIAETTDDAEKTKLLNATATWIMYGLHSAAENGENGHEAHGIHSLEHGTDEQKRAFQIAHMMNAGNDTKIGDYFRKKGDTTADLHSLTGEKLQALIGTGTLADLFKSDTSYVNGATVANPDGTDISTGWGASGDARMSAQKEWGMGARQNIWSTNQAFLS